MPTYRGTKAATNDAINGTAAVFQAIVLLLMFSFAVLMIAFIIAGMIIYGIVKLAVLVHRQRAQRAQANAGSHPATGLSSTGTAPPIAPR